MYESDYSVVRRRDEVLEKLVALVRLAEIDISARDLESELEEAPEQLKELKDDVRRLEELLNAERQEVNEAKNLFQAQEEEIREHSQALIRSKAKSAKARSMREVDAVEREMEVIRRTLRERETERDRLKEAIEQRSNTLDQHQKEFEELQALMKKEVEKTQERIENLRRQKEEILGGRDEEISKLPSSLVKRYDLIRSRRGGVGVSRIEGDICSGCHVLLTPQQVIAVQKAETLEQCPRCQRIMYMSNVIEKATHPDVEDEESE